ncbi:GRM8 [Symbiodinium natans]|uniref:GRM8 protein n=1 Tax=Symbiodinium natans TaxID=878477 RepID=A0A812T2V8_9DINO|nr:GRM8 [Symbiodinium natans]
MEEQAKLAGEEDRLKGVSLRYMPNSFVNAEAITALNIAKGLGSRFLFTSMNSQMFNKFAPVMVAEGFMGPDWQILGSESATTYGPEMTDADLPIGFQRWNPVSRGTKFPLFTDMWKLMNTNDVTSAAARTRYGIDNFKVPLASATVPAIVDSDFTDVVLPSYDTFLFDALYTLVIAINNLLNQGNALSAIQGELLLTEVRQTSFTGISGQV